MTQMRQGSPARVYFFRSRSQANAARARTLMDAYDRLLIEIYRAAREAPLSDFREIALEAIKPVVPFDTASWGIVRFAPEGVIVDGGYLYRLPDSMIAEHAQVQHCEPTVPIERLADPV